MYEWLKELPLYWGKIMSTAGFAGMVIWVWFRPRRFIYNEAPDQKRWRDLRIWASILLSIQIIIYLSF